MTVLSKLQQLNDVTGNAKLDLLKSMADDKDLRLAFEAAYNPYLNYWVSTFPEPMAKKQNPSVTLPEAIAFIKTIRSRSNETLEQLTDMAARMTQSDETALRLILARDLRCGVQIKTINKVWDNLIPIYPVMLCKNADDKTKKHIDFPAYVQTKMDGMRVNIVVQESFVDVFSRSGKPLLTHGVFNHLTDLVVDHGSFVIDGELLFDFGELHNRQTGNGLGNKAVRQTISPEEAAGMYVAAWDLIPFAHFQDGRYDTPYATRFGQLVEMTQRVERVNVVTTAVMNDWEGIDRLFNEMLSIGEEGVIVKNKHAPWGNTRSKDMLKLKAEKEVELRIVGYLPGKGKFEGMVGSFIMRTDDGGLEVNVSGMSDDLRKNATENFDNYFDKVATVRYNAYITSKGKEKAALFLPRLVTIREDKDETNTTKEIEVL